MADSPPAKGKVMAPIKMAPDPVSRAGAKLPSLTARFYQRMKRQRVYPLVVRWGKVNNTQEAASLQTPALVVRPIVPGALVVPAELPLEPGSTASATFHVTPLALGRLPSARVEILHQGKNVNVLPLKIIVVRQLISWVLLALAVIVPLLLIFTTREHKLTSEPKLRHLSENEKAALKTRREPAAANGKNKPGGKNAAPKANAKAKETEPDNTDENTRMTELYTPKPGEVLEYHLNQALPGVPGITDKIAWGLGEGYQRVCDTMQDIPQLAMYIAAGFLVLAFLSWFLHTTCRGTVSRKQMALPHAA